MARLSPFRGIRFDPGVVDFGAVLAPPYDVITPEQQCALYARDLRNIVRIDFGKDYAGDEPGVHDRHTRGRDHLEAWLKLGVLRRDRTPSIYISEHGFRRSDGGHAVRRGLFAAVSAEPWERAEILPHEHTMRGPKEDRLRLMRATNTLTSAVFGLWSGAGPLQEQLDVITQQAAAAAGSSAGEMGNEEHRLWQVDDPEMLSRLLGALAPATLYIADGHHRYETAVAYAQERGVPGSVLLYLAAADDPSIEIAATHRLLPARTGVPDSLAALRSRLAPGQHLAVKPTLGEAMRAAASSRDEHVVAVAAADGSALLHWPRTESTSPRERLDVVALQEQVLATACGIDEDALRAGAVRYTRALGEVERAVQAGEAVLGFAVLPCTTAELLAVADAHEVMPQKSTYFYPKVPTGLVLEPLD